MNIEMRRITSEKVHEAVMIWNKVVEDGVAFPQTEPLDDDTGAEFFASQDYTAVAFDTDTAEVVGMYILHPNNVGRCGHICNASYAVRSDMRGKHIGELLVTDCLKKAKELGYKILQFNAVVATNTSALELYKKLGFVQLGVIPGGFLMKDGHYEDIIVHYHTL
ncbi:MAG: GNAT family N-acetyltransferase [Oscillospiraceae bacterium]|jgi:acetyltransferase, GNAT family|uniref:GNAT family N-acetyltransferase n=1 Tax=Huintestinicola butyrica TaxID=2981728 RepID=UPI000821AEC2|nr:GNAT family N-acetyltransferase [Huintestinicola butyrica]MBS1403657.1 GNAT family N-acetyltransferase [Oscillospiraceae bacterium]MCU6728492.1 GNAT family N-acetyltransferase [Huintestinicola butyrica]SCJ15856.1 Putative phosphinothricin acetyltransferase YwnH [uncultured Ruminococcus sp.]